MEDYREDGLVFESRASLTIVVVSCHHVHGNVDLKIVDPHNLNPLKNVDSINMLKLTKILIIIN